MFTNFGTSFGVNYAANLPAYDTKDLQIIFGTMVSDYVITVYRRTLNLHLILQIDSSLDLCKTITYLCEDDSGIADMADTALDGPIKEQFISMPKIRTFHGFAKGGFRHKLAVEQLECIYQSDILRSWFNNQLAQSIENACRRVLGDQTAQPDILGVLDRDDEGDVAVLDAHAVEVAVRASHELAVYAVDLAHALGRIDDEVVHAVHDVAPLPGSGGLHNPLACWLARDFGEEGRLSVMRKAGAASLLKRRVLTRLSVGRTVAFRQDRCGGAGEGGSGGGERRGVVPVPSGTGRA